MAHCEMESCSIGSDYLHATVRAQGAELVSLRTTNGLDLLWDGDPAVWPRQAPILFPIVGSLKENSFLYQGRSFRLDRHGFARDRRFRITRLSRQSCTMVLESDEETLSLFPFPFELRVRFVVQESNLIVYYDVLNPGKETLFASIGAHPAFRWPLLPEAPRESHIIEFEQPEPSPVRRLNTAGLLRSEPVPSPVAGNTGRMLTLKDGLFTDNVIVFDQLQSRAVRYYAPTTPVIEIAWEGFQELGLWTIPGAGFISIEPWRGHASPEDFEGEFIRKPGLFTVEPEGRRSFAYAVSLYE